MEKKLHGLMTTPLPLVGLNASGIAIGDDDGYDTVDVATNPDGDDQLVQITQLPCRPMYFKAGFTTDSKMYLRRPALLQTIEVDDTLERFFNWRLQITDPYRPWNVQAAGHTQAIKDAALTLGLGLDLDQVKDMIRDALNDTLHEDGMRFLMKILKAAQPIFSAVPLVATPEGMDPQVAKSAANLGIEFEGGELNRYAQNTHATGGVPDMEPIDADTGKLINMGCPVDFVSIVSALGFFEDAPPTILLPDLEKAEIDPSLS